LVYFKVTFHFLDILVNLVTGHVLQMSTTIKTYSGNVETN
jgi:hypothetical protein